MNDRFAQSRLEVLDESEDILSRFDASDILYDSPQASGFHRAGSFIIRRGHAA